MSDVKEQENPQEAHPPEPARAASADTPPHTPLPATTAQDAPPPDTAAAAPPSSDTSAPAAAQAETAAPDVPPADTQSSTAGLEPPKKKKKKKRKLESGEGEAGEPIFERPALDAEGRERPRFLLRFPEDPELEELIRAFEAGNFRKVREDGPRLAERTERPEVKRAAEELLRRIEPDPLVKFLLGVAVFLFVAIVAYVYHSHG